MTERKINAMHRQFGTCGAFQCRGCEHLLSGDYRGRRYHKCELYGLSHGEGTDWRLHWQACGMYNMETDPDSWIPVKDTLLQQPRFQDYPLDGQLTISDFE